MERTIITTADGSKTIHIPAWNENYHSSHGALQEAKHVFLTHGLAQKINQPTIQILEIGFGTGLNTILSLEFGQQTKSKIQYHGLEAYPISEEEMIELEYEKLLPNKDLISQYHKIHSTPWEVENEISPQFSLTKIQNTLQQQIFSPSYYDLIYFDAFGPRVQEDMWTQEIFQKLYNSLKKSGILVTYCAKGQVKRDLKTVGFEVEPLPGPPGKREMTRAIKK